MSEILRKKLLTRADLHGGHAGFVCDLFAGRNRNNEMEAEKAALQKWKDWEPKLVITSSTNSLFSQSIGFRTAFL